MCCKVLGNKPHITSRSDRFLELSPTVSLKQQQKTEKKKKGRGGDPTTTTMLARLLWGVKATLLWKGSVNPYYAEINGGPIFAGCTRRRMTRAQRFA